MTTRKLHTICFYLLVLIMGAACSNTRHLPAGDSLYIGSEVHIKDHTVPKNTRKALTSDLLATIRPRPNSKFLGMRLKLRLYNFAGTPKKDKGLKAWLHKKVGEPPVLASSMDAEHNRMLMVNTLENRGFFHAVVKPTVKTNKKRKTKVYFDVTTGPQYKVDSVTFLKNDSKISVDIDSDFEYTLLRKGMAYNLDVIKEERNRIDAAMKERGYYYFKPDYILVQADTGIGDHKVDLFVKLKDDVPDDVYDVYRINNIYIYPNFRLNVKAKDTDKVNTVLYKGYYINDRKNTFNPTVFSDAMIFKKGDLYSKRDQNKSLSRLVNMGTFKFVKNRFEPIDDSLLDVYYYLTPYPKKSIRFEIGALTQNDNRAGSQASISWKNRNTFKGGEELQLKLSGGFEAQYSGIVKQPNIYNLGAETDLSFPRFIVPFGRIESPSQFLPRTLIKASYNYESESDLLRISSYKLSYGYDWKEGPRKEHQLYPFNFTYVRTDTLGNADQLNLLYGNLIFDGIILGPTYEFTYTSNNGSRKNTIYFDGLVDMSGNILGIAQHADYKTDPKTIFGSLYAQYVKIQPDFRYYLKLSSAATLASRVMAGIGIPYGNSQNLPNIKQFWAGGNSDLRGFPSRLLGPGTFNEYYLYNSNSYLETLGDMKLEFNAELRQNLYKFINGAVFFDAGNIWLYHDNPAFPGGKFTSDFYKELAADMGIGLRFDFKILVLRFDLGFPVREPWLPANNRWVFNKINFGDPAWRKDNLVFNIGIGYPF